MGSSAKKGNAFTNNPIVKTIGTQRLVVFIAVILLYFVFFSMSSAFRQYTTMISIMENCYYLGFIAIGVTFCLITGGVDLSIGTGMICYTLVGAYLTSDVGLPAIVGLVVCLVFGIIMGVFNGFLVAVLDIPPFIATLCSMMITRGLGSIISHGQSSNWPSIAAEEGWFKNFFRYTTADGLVIPIGIIYLIVMAVLMTIVLNKTKVGRYIIGIGSNKEALRLSGVNVVKWQWIAYIISGTCAGLAGIMYAGIMSSSIAPGGGAGMELNAIGGAIIGGTSMTGGEGSIFGTMLGMLVMVLLSVGLPSIGLQANFQQIFTGLILILAITIDVMKNKK